MIKNKQFDCEGQKYNIKVEMNVETERSPTGYHWHEITINNIGQTNSYYEKELIRVRNGTPTLSEVELIQGKIDEMMNEVFNSVKKSLSPIENMFDELGFE
jgi:hypothetical protein